MMKIFGCKPAAFRSVQLATAALFIVTAVAVGCRPKPSASVDASRPIEAGTSNSFFTAVSSQKIRTAPGARVEPIVGKDGSVHQIKIIARDNDDFQTVTCECFSACSGSCTATREELGTVIDYSCSGSCTNSEGNHCSLGCVFTTPPDGGSGSGSSTHSTSSVTPVVNPNR